MFNFWGEPNVYLSARLGPPPFMDAHNHTQNHSPPPSPPPSGYGQPPWVFRGSALYQLHLVKSDTARAFIPKDFRLVEAFGYTLGGFFLAHYDDSPAGKFDELVVIAGTVWNPPTSCAWAARVLVSSDEACAHGRKDVGLPSRVAKFLKTVKAIPRASESKSSGFLRMVGMSSTDSPKTSMDIQVSEMKGMAARDMCNINLSTPGPEVESSSRWMGPLVKLSLPSFSGRTKYNHHLLKYSCQIACRVRAVAPAKVLGAAAAAAASCDEEEGEVGDETSCTKEEEDNKVSKRRTKKRRLSLSVLLSKPVLALQFDRLEMKVEAPTLYYTP